MDEKVAQQKQHFNEIAELYERSRQHPNHLKLKELIWGRFFRGGLTVRNSPVRVLEPMCGFADGYDILSKHVSHTIDYSGFDYSDEVVSRLKSNRPSHNVWQQDVSKFSSDRKFDIIILLGGLHHVPHIASNVVSRLADSLADGGYFINLEPTHGNLIFQKIRQRIYDRNPLFDEETERAFSVGELYSFFTNAGLHCELAMYPGLLAYTLYYNPDAFPGLNIGTPTTVNAIWTVEKPFVNTWIAKKLSFATLSLWRKPAA